MSSKIERVKPHMEFEDELHLHQVGWVIQRIGWTVLFLILIAAIAGLFGDGYLSHVSLEDGNNAVEFERFGRFESSMQIRINATDEGGRIQLVIPQNYLNEVEIEKIIPEPQEQMAEKGAYRFTYLFNAPAQITVYLTPRKTGMIHTTLGVNSSEFMLSHYIYP